MVRIILNECVLFTNTHTENTRLDNYATDSGKGKRIIQDIYKANTSIN